MVTQNALLTINDYESRAKETMPKALFDRLFGELGAPDWTSNTANVLAMESVKLRPRVLVDVSRRDLSTEVLGQRISLPVMLAPTGTHQRAHPAGELASAHAAAAAGTIMGLSTASSYSIEEVAQAAENPLWFQLYFFQNRELTEILVRRAENAGYAAIMLTVDNLGANSREREHRYAYILESERILKNFQGIELPDLPTRENFAESFESALNWRDLEWLRSLTAMPLVIKGVQTAEDARLCAENGVEALVVSNHGGHAMQGTDGAINMLPAIADAVGDRLEVYLDGGVRRGADVLKSPGPGRPRHFHRPPDLLGAVGSRRGRRPPLSGNSAPGTKRSDGAMRRNRCPPRRPVGSPQPRRRSVAGSRP